MSLTACDKWVWFFDPQKDRLMLDFGNGEQFCSRYNARKLKEEAFTSQGFLLHDIESYYRIQEIAEKLTLTEQKCKELVLNTLIIKHFAKPILLKSWLFLPISNSFIPKFGSLVTATTSKTQQSIHLFVAETDAQSSICLLLDGELLLNNKQYLFGDPFKVMHNRLHPIDSSHHHYAPTIKVEVC